MQIIVKTGETKQLSEITCGLALDLATALSVRPADSGNPIPQATAVSEGWRESIAKAYISTIIDCLSRMCLRNTCTSR
jgi:hypothetical protein